MLAGISLLASSCSTVKTVRLRDDFEQVDKHRIKRLLVVVQPLVDESEKVSQFVALMVRRYVNLKRDFLVTSQGVSPKGFDTISLCNESVDGVLRVESTFAVDGDGMESSAILDLRRCHDGETVWHAEAAGSFPQRDDGLSEVTATYASQFGDEVRPFVAPVFHVLRPALDTLPQPALSDEEVTEKMGLDE